MYSTPSRLSYLVIIWLWGLNSSTSLSLSLKSRRKSMTRYQFLLRQQLKHLLLKKGYIDVVVFVSFTEIFVMSWFLFFPVLNLARRICC